MFEEVPDSVAVLDGVNIQAMIVLGVAHWLAGAKEMNMSFSWRSARINKCPQPQLVVLYLDSEDTATGGQLNLLPVDDF